MTKEVPCSSQFLAIVEFVKSEGFDMDKHKIVTNFPRRILTDLDTKQTLKELGLFPKEMVIVQKKWYQKSHNLMDKFWPTTSKLQVEYL